MNKIIFLSILFLLLTGPIYLHMPTGEHNECHTLLMVINPGFWKTSVLAEEKGEDKPNIQWFKEEMKISPKYLEKNQGILGMSWAHFFTMVFLFAFGTGGLIVFILRYKRTKEIIKLIKEEREYGSKD